LAFWLKISCLWPSGEKNRRGKKRRCASLWALPIKTNPSADSTYEAILLIQRTHKKMNRWLLLTFVSVSGATTPGYFHDFSKACSVFPGFSQACCDGLIAAENSPAFQQANGEMLEMSGEATAGAFQRCDASNVPCSFNLPNATRIEHNITKNPVEATCCSSDGAAGWALPGPKKAVDALIAAGEQIPGGGILWYVKVNQTVINKGKIFRKVITHQYPAWFPTTCNDTKQMGYFEAMMCYDSSVLECIISVSTH
jgi:hypothetical protein